MKYMGSKARFAQDIVPVLNSYLSNDRRYYIEPFVGGANIINKVDFEFRIGYDYNQYLIALLNHVSKSGSIPLSISETEYYKVRDNKKDYPKWYVGLVGFCASYGGKFFAGYPRGKKPDGTPRDYTNEAIRNIEKQRLSLIGITFQQANYRDLDFRELDALIYCDPPYAESTSYHKKDNFNTYEFWNWVRKQSNINPVVVSEYTAPNDFSCIWSKDGIKSNLVGKGTKESMEKMFVLSKWKQNKFKGTLFDV